MEAQTFEFEAIGTRWQIAIADPLEASAKESLRKRIDARIETFDRAYSRFRSDSLVAEMAQHAGTYELPDDAEPMLSLYERLYGLTNGAITPLIGQVLADAGYDADYSLKPKAMTSPPRWEDVLEYRFPKLTLKRPALLDFGALGKGYLIDIIGALLRENGIRSYVLDVGGDFLRSEQGEPLRIGLEDPLAPGKVIGVATLTEPSLCGSAGTRRAWDRFHHIINPHTLESPRHVVATWTVAKTALVADALATSLFFVPPETLRPHFDFEYVVFFPDRSALVSPGFPGELFS